MAYVECVCVLPSRAVILACVNADSVVSNVLPKVTLVAIGSVRAVCARSNAARSALLVSRVLCVVPVALRAVVNAHDFVSANRVLVNVALTACTFVLVVTCSARAAANSAKFVFWFQRVLVVSSGAFILALEVDQKVRVHAFGASVFREAERAILETGFTETVSVVTVFAIAAVAVAQIVFNF